MLEINVRNDEEKAKRRKKLKREAEVRQKAIDKQYKKFMKKNKGWPTAKKQQIVQRRIKHYE